MSRCVRCGLLLESDHLLCPWHPLEFVDNWATANRIQCDFFHRGRLTGRDSETLDEWLARDRFFWPEGS